MGWRGLAAIWPATARKLSGAVASREYACRMLRISVALFSSQPCRRSCWSMRDSAHRLDARKAVAFSLQPNDADQCALCSAILLGLPIGKPATARGLSMLSNLISTGLNPSRRVGATNLSSLTCLQACLPRRWHLLQWPPTPHQLCWQPGLQSRIAQRAQAPECITW